MDLALHFLVRLLQQGFLEFVVGNKLGKRLHGKVMYGQRAIGINRPADIYSIGFGLIVSDILLTVKKALWISCFVSSRYELLSLHDTIIKAIMIKPAKTAAVFLFLFIFLLC